MKQPVTGRERKRGGEKEGDSEEDRDRPFWTVKRTVEK
jgi:hypothetical protein